MLVWKKSEKAGIEKNKQKVSVGARSINNINTFLIFLPPSETLLKRPHTPKIPLSYSRAYKKTTAMVLLLNKKIQGVS